MKKKEANKERENQHQNNNSNYFKIYDWMITNLQLTSNDLLVFAVIFSFCEAGKVFTGAQSYLSKKLGVTDRGIRKNLAKLLERNLVIKTNKKNGCEYIVNIDNMPDTTAVQKLKENMRKAKTVKEIKENKEKQKKQVTYNDILNEELSDSNLKTAFTSYIQMRMLKKNPPTNEGLRLTIKQLKKLSSLPSEQIEIVNQSVKGGYVELYPLKKPKETNNKTGGKSISWNNYHQREYTPQELEDLERRLLTSWLKEN